MESSNFGIMPQVEIPFFVVEEQGKVEKISRSVKSELLPMIPSGASLISIDGLDGVGKSTLAKIVAMGLGATLLQIDDYLLKNQNCYLDALDFSSLQGDINSAERCVVEGCLVGEVLAQLSLESEFSVYVARTSKMLAQPGMDWVEERDLLFGAKDASIFVSEEEEDLKKWSSFFDASNGTDEIKLSGLRRELICYHICKQPHLKADVLIRVAETK